MLIDRLVFGCARLPGSGEARHATALIDRALTAGIRAFDTAPPYGMGSAERIMGRVLRGCDDVRIITKVGLRPPSHSWLRGQARWLKSLLVERPSLLDHAIGPAAAPPARGEGNFAPAAMRESLNRSLEHLQRDRVDTVLLHEAGRDDWQDDVAAFLAEARDSGLCARTGYSHGASFDRDTAAAFPIDQVAQTALPSDWTDAAGAGSRAVTWHGVGRHGLDQASRNPGLNRALTSTREWMGRIAVSDRSHALAAIYALVHARWPGASLIVASSDCDRFDQLLRAIAHVDEIVDPATLTTILAAEQLLPIVD